MKDFSYSWILGFALGGYLARFVRGAWYWDATTWGVIVFFSLYIYAIWKLDTRNEVDE